MLYFDKFIDNTLDGMNEKTVLNVIPGSILEGVTIGTESLDIRAEEIAMVVKKEVGFYVTTIIPKIKEVFKGVERDIATAKKDLLAGGPSIVSIEIPKELVGEDMSFDSELDYMENTDVLLESKNAQDIRGLIGESTFIDNISDSVLETVWEDYIILFGNSNSNIANATNIKTLTNKTNNYVFIIYYILKGMMKESFVDGTGKIEKFRDNRERYFNYIKGVITRRIATIKNAKSRELLVINAYRKNSTVMVVAENYLPYIKTGGTPDAILGTLYLTLEKDVYSINDLTTEKLALEKSYRSNQLNLHSKVNSQISQLTFNSLNAHITKMVSDLENGEDIYDDVKEFISDLELSALNAPIRIIEDIYADILYKKSNLKEFLRLTRVYAEGSTIRHAKTLAISDMVATYLLHAIEVTENK